MQLPYLALRYEEDLVQDERLDGDGNPLRKSRVLLFLALGRKASEGRVETPHLYDAKISFLVTGIDDWRWTAIAFADALFDKDASIDRIHMLTNDIGRPNPVARGLLLNASN